MLELVALGKLGTGNGIRDASHGIRVRVGLWVPSVDFK